jgi:hypothetical protein
MQLESQSSGIKKNKGISWCVWSPSGIKVTGKSFWKSHWNYNSNNEVNDCDVHNPVINYNSDRIDNVHTTIQKKNIYKIAGIKQKISQFTNGNKFCAKLTAFNNKVGFNHVSLNWNVFWTFAAVSF